MKLIVQPSTDSCRNLAAEEALFQQVDEDILYLWRNAPSVIIGRNQNTLTEVNQEFARSHNIKIARRLTGGGAVYQDLGNINFSYIFRCEEHAESFDERVQAFLKLFIAYLRSLQINPVLTGRNDICIRDNNGNLRKIAGTAMTQKEDRGIFHLCLLFDANMDVMAKVLTPSLEKLRSKGVASVRSRTINLKASYPQFSNWSKDDFFASAIEFFRSRCTLIGLPEGIESSIDNLLQNRYENDLWTYGRNPAGSMTCAKRFPIGTVELSMEIRKGKITQCAFSGDYLTNTDLEKIAKALIGKDFDEECISAELSGFDLETILNIVDRKAFIDFLFGRRINDA